MAVENLSKFAVDNPLRRAFSDSEESEIMSDFKSGQFLVLKNNPFGFDTIALRGYEDPKQIVDFVETYVDRNKTFQRELQNKLDDFYTEGEGAKFLNPSSPDYIPGMEDYNTVSGGFLNTITGGRAGTPTTFGLQGAYQKRIDTIENTLKDKYNMSDAEIADAKAGKYKGDVDTDLIKRIEDLGDAKKAEADILGITAAEDKRLGEAKAKQTIADAIRERDLGTGPIQQILHRIK